MDERQDTLRPEPKATAETVRAEREARLAAALRENLRRRKAQARARKAAKPEDERR
jgi:hypothetical protein